MTALTQITIIPASDAELSGEDPQRIESYRQYWAVEPLNPEKPKFVWKKTTKEILLDLKVTQGQMQSIITQYPVQITGIECPGCGGPLLFVQRMSAQQALRGGVRRCETCMDKIAEERHAQAVQKEKEFAALERKTQEAFYAVICDDHRPEDCVSSLNQSQIRLYLDMLKMQREDIREYIGQDINGKDLYTDQNVTLWVDWPSNLGDKYKKAGPDLYELARHRIIKPLRFLAEYVTLTRHGLINPSGYPALTWEVEEELDGWPLVGIMGRQLRLLGDSAEEE